MSAYERPRKREFDEAFAALRAAGLEADADHPIADRYRAAGRAVNHASRKLDHIDPQLVADLADAVEFQLDNLDDWPMGEEVLRRAHAVLRDGCTCQTCAPEPDDDDDERADYPDHVLVLLRAATSAAERVAVINAHLPEIQAWEAQA